MRKIFTFLFAALMSVGMFAKVTPKGTDVWDETTKTLTVNGNPVSYAYSGVSDIENLVISDAVTSIGDDAFYNCIGLKSVSFGSSLTSLGEEAFANCSKLESVTLPASLESIGKSAFNTCGNLTEVTIPDGVTSIGQKAFYYCEKLTSVTIPNSVASIGSQAFLRCGGLTEIVVAAENPNYCSENGVLFNKDKTTLIQYPGGKQGEYTIPNSVTSIGNLAFSMCSLLTSVEIPNSVVEIVDYAFQSCSGLTSVNIGNGVTSIGKYAFYYCSNLASVTIHATTPPTLGGSALDKTAAALTIYVPAASVTDYKGAWTAYADKIEAAGGTPANACGDGLTWALNDDVLTISYDGTGTGAMNNWDDENHAPWYDDAPDIKYIEIAEGVTSIGAYAFDNCDFKYIDLPASVTSIGNNAFNNMYGQGLTILSTTCTLPQDLFDNGNFEHIYVPAASVATYQALFPDDDYRFSEIPSVQQTDNVILWDYNLCTSIMAGSPRDEMEILNYHNTQGGITVTAEVDLILNDYECGFIYGGIIFEGTGKLIFTSTVGNITHIEISGDTYSTLEITGWTWTPGEGGDNGTLSWSGDAASVELPIAQSTNLENTEVKFTLKDGGTTAIENTAVDTKAVKRIVNGQLLIIRDGKLYNATGAEVK